jgi:catechol 2,3-dioxygenase-like lactoylglutathione lyase family enzyme
MPRFDFIGLVVNDMPTTLAFYRALGLDIPAEADAEGHVEVTLTGGFRLAWDTVAIVSSFDPAWTPPVGGHRASLDFLCSTPAEVDVVYAGLAASGPYAHVPPFDAPWGQRYAVLHDPDGNAVALYAAL